MKRPGSILPRATMRRIVAVLDTPTDSFVALARIAGLDPAIDFRGADLRDVDFGADDLTGFDFSDSDLTGAELSRATGLDNIVTTRNTRFPNRIQVQTPGFDPAAAQRMILAGKAPPKDWWPLITKLNFVTEPIRDLSPVSELFALQ